LESEPGQGSCFSFTIPLQVADNQPAGWRDLPPYDFSDRHILLLIRNLALERSLTQLFHFLGLHVTAVAPHYFHEKDVNEPPDLLFIDDAVLEQLNSKEKEGLEQLVSVMSTSPILLAYPVRADYETFFSDGIEPLLLNKPLTLKELFQTLNCQGKCRVGALPCQAEEQVAEVISDTKNELRVLVADDNRGNQVLIRTFLKKFDLTVDCVDNGEEVLRKVQETEYDVVFMDVNMPVMDGLEATRYIRAEVDPARQPWIIAVTGNVAAEDRQACTDAGMDDFLKKPFAKAAFQRVLTAVREHKIS
jgi:CheY-like chemotaxis protein